MNSDSNNEQIYLKKYLSYKNKYLLHKKYLESNQAGGWGQNQVNQYCLYLCFDSSKTENAINMLNNDFKIYNNEEIAPLLHLGAYKINFNDSVFKLVTAPHSEKKLKKSNKLVPELYIDGGLDRMKVLSRINLMKIIKEFEKKINENSNTNSNATAESSETSNANIDVTSILIFKLEKDHMELVLSYTRDGDELKDKEINDKFDIKFIDKPENVRKSFFKFR